MSFTNQTVIVTGSASGLGKAIATAFAHAGASTVLCDVNKSRLDAAVTELQDAKAPGPVTAVECNITSEGSAASLIEAAKKHGSGRIDVLVNCAGVMDRLEPAGQCDREIWDRVINVNLTGTFTMTKLVVNAMLAQEPAGGVILNVGSVGGMKGGVAGAAYTASKHGILGLTKNTAAFYAKQGIRCNAILPGGMNTDIQASIPGGQQTIKPENYGVVASNMAMQPAMCDLADMSKLVLAICGEQGKIMNGACVPADNGWTAN